MTMLYANRPALEYAVHSGEPYEGRHCYEYMMGLDAQCPFCPLRRMNGGVSDEGEVDNGKEIYAFKTRVTSWNGRQAFVEYAWNITELRRAEKVFAA